MASCSSLQTGHQLSAIQIATSKWKLASGQPTQAVFMHNTDFLLWTGIIELDDLKERRERVAEECRRLEERLSLLEQQRQGQQRQAALATTVEEFCRNISAALDNPSFETKQKILRLVVERVKFVEDQITIKHVIPIADVRLQRDQLSTETPNRREILSHSDIDPVQGFRNVFNRGFSKRTESCARRRPS